jgi:hypothetical protein
MTWRRAWSCRLKAKLCERSLQRTRDLADVIKHILASLEFVIWHVAFWQELFPRRTYLVTVCTMVMMTTSHPLS